MLTHEVQVSIYGNDFTLRTQDYPAAREALAKEVDAAMRKMGEDSGLMQAQKVATLTALHFAEEAQKAREDGQALKIRATACLDTLEPLLSQAVSNES